MAERGRSCRIISDWCTVAYPHVSGSDPFAKAAETFSVPEDIVHRKDIRFPSHGLNCAGWSYEGTSAAGGKRPCIVMAHGLGAIKEMRLDAYAIAFATAGYNVLVFDYRHFGDSQGEPRQILSPSRQLEDWRAAVEYTRSLRTTDPDRIVLWGTSLSGGHVIATAAKDPRVAAVISQVPHFNAIAALSAIGPFGVVRLTTHACYDLLKALLGLAPHYIASSAPPGRLAFMAQPGSDEGYLDLVPPGHLFDRRIAARFGILAAFYSPGNALPNLSIPCLVQVAMRDNITPPGAAIAACRRSKSATLKTYDCGHFDPYVPPLFEIFVKDQIDFLRAHVI
jgi:pimeloyl-ACP methyl ester carboxylesterase